MKGFQKKVLDNLQLIPEQPNALNVKLDTRRGVDDRYSGRLSGAGPGYRDRKHRTNDFG